MNFTHLHVHSDNSLLEGFGTVKEYVNKAQSLGMKAVAITDKNTMTGIFELLQSCKRTGLKPICGVDFNIAPIIDGSTVLQDSPVIYKPNAPQYLPNKGGCTHLTVLAKNETGLRNLFKLLTSSFDPKNFFSWKLQEIPRLPIEELFKHKEGLIVLSGAPTSEINVRLRYGQIEEAYSFASRIKAVFEDDFYIEINDWKLATGYSNKHLIQLAKKLNIKPVLCNDVYYAEQSQANSQEQLMAIGSKSKMAETPSYLGGMRLALGGNNRYFKSFEEMNDVFPYEKVPFLYNNVQEVVDKIEPISLEYNSHLRPKLPLPDGFSTDLEYFDYLVAEGFKKKRSHESKEIQEESLRKIKEEREIIYGNDFVSYFLVVQDYLNWSVEHGYPIGPGRGCFLPGNQVTGLKNKLWNIEDVKEGQRVRTHDGSYQKVEKLWKYDIKEKIIELSLSNGKKITSTVDHLIFEKNKGFTEAQDLKVGDVLLGAKGSRELIGPMFCVNCQKENNNIDVKKSRHSIYKEQPYKKIGEYLCNDCKNKKLYLIPAVKEGLKKAGQKSKTLESRKKNSQSLKLHWKTHREERIEKFRAWLNSEESNDYRETKRKQALKKYSDPKHLEILTSLKNKKYKSGYFHSHQQNDKEIYYASSYELKALNIFETDSEVKEFDRFKDVIKWKDENNITRSYLPDFLVKYKDGTKKIIEVKALWQTKTSEVLLKKKAAENYAEEHNMTYEIWTETELNLKNDLRHNEYVITGIKIFDYEGPVYDLKVENVHNYTVSDVTVHNSVGGSEIAYLLNISNTDPIRFDLLFERFISDGRGAIYEIEYEDGTKEELLVNNKKVVNGEVKFIHQLSVGDEVEDFE